MATSKSDQTVDVQKAIKDLSSNLNSLTVQTTAAKRGLRRAKENLKIVSDYLSTAKAKTTKPGSDEPQATSIEGFFNAVGTGVREAQESLDLQSVEYMRNRPSFAPETIFRVPKASAKLKLGMTYSEKEGINFLVVERGSETSRTMEQEISFDIVSAPAPPDSLEGFAKLPIGPILITSAIERELVLKRLLEEKKVTTHSGDAGQVIASMLLKDAFRRVLVIRGEESWTLMLVKPPEERLPPPSSPNLSASFLVLPFEQGDGGTKSLIPNQRMKHFYTLLFPIVDKQSRMLMDLERI